jgi:Sortase domain
VRRAPRSALLALLGAGLVLVVGGALLTTRPPRADAPDIGRPVDAAASSATASPQAGPATAATPPTATAAVPEQVAAPVELTVPGGGDAVPLTAIGVLSSGDLALPDRPSVLGWYAGGAVPGDPAGTAVVAGHVDSAQYGIGPLHRLAVLALGDRLTVTDAAGDLHVYAVISRTTYRKRDLPRDVFRTDGPPQLALVTCGGAFDRSTGSYEDNVVVLASAVPATAPVSAGRMR